MNYQAAISRLASDATTAEVVQALRAHGVRPLLIKGPVLERLLYTDGTPRLWGDIDLVVEAERFEEAERVLSGLGFRMSAADVTHDGLVEHEHEWVREAHSVDLHRGILGVGGPPRTVWQTLTHRAEQIQIGGAEVDVPAVPVTALLVALHTASHGPAHKPLEDLRRALATWDEDIWRAASAIAVSIAAEGPFGLGLGTLESGRALHDRLGLELDASVDARLLAQGSVPLSRGFQRLAEARTPRARLALLREELVPTPHFMRWRYGLGERDPAGLARAYVMRWLTFLRQVPRGWRAWRRATKDG